MTREQRQNAILAKWLKVFPSSNQWGVPDLLPELQATEPIDHLFKYGSRSRSRPVPGASTIHFYTDDYRFNNLWLDPSPIITASPAAIAEPNFTTTAVMPRAAALWTIYKKRWLARLWQDYDVTIFVDLNIHPEFSDLALLGVPVGWRAYFTRGYPTEPELLDIQHAWAVQQAAGAPILFHVFAGGIKIRDYCQTRGFTWWPQWWHQTFE